MFTFVLSTLRSRWAAFLGILVAASTAVALTTACGFLLETGIRGNVNAERLAGVSIIVAADQNISVAHGTGDDRETFEVGATERRRIDAALVDIVATTPGVLSAVGEVSFSAHLLDASGNPTEAPADGVSWGHSWSSAAATSFSIVTGHEPTNPTEIAINEELSRAADVGVGDKVGVIANGTRIEATIAATLSHTPDQLEHQTAIFFADATANQLYGHPGQVDLVTVLVAPGHDITATARSLRDRVDSEAVVITGDDRGRAEFVDSANASVALIAIAGSLGGIAAVVATMVIAGMLALIVQQRHREIALLRAIAATPRQVRRAIKLETVTVVGLGACLGIVPGGWIARGVLGIWRDKGIVPTSFDSPHGILPAAIALAMTIMIGYSAAHIAGRRASRIRPIEALSESSLQPRRIGIVRPLLGSLLIAGTGAVFAVAMNIDGYLAPALVPAIVVLMFLVIGVLAPLLVSAGVWFLSSFTTRLGPTAYLAGMNTRARTRRLASTVTPIVLAIGMAGMGFLQQSTNLDQRAQQSHDRLIGDQVVASTIGLPRAIVDELVAAPMVIDAIGVRTTEVFTGYDLNPTAAVGVTPGDLDQVLDLDVLSGSLDDLTGDTIAISQNLADESDATTGTPMSFHLGDGTPVSYLVVAVFDRSVGFADLVLPDSLIVDHVTNNELNQVFLNVDNARTAGDAAIRAIVDHYPGARHGTTEILIREDDANAKTQSWVG
ncbi:MAG TPA: FtsX-like permease family protein, partial [Ilumatobacteraceae bacterium]|nr:FtsX-like permease family protein [Ilumatobacteraceae bacterium]